MPTPCLFLDDDEIRHEIFILNHTGADITQVRSANEAIQALEKASKFDFVFLDHDLSFGHYNGKGYNKAGTGMDVVDFMCSNLDKVKRPSVIIIHSWNDIRAVEMQTRLFQAEFKNVYISPFDAINYTRNSRFI